VNVVSEDTYIYENILIKYIVIVSVCKFIRRWLRRALFVRWRNRFWFSSKLVDWRLLVICMHELVDAVSITTRRVVSCADLISHLTETTSTTDCSRVILFLIPFITAARRTSVVSLRVTGRLAVVAISATLSPVSHTSSVRQLNARRLSPCHAHVSRCQWRRMVSTTKHGVRSAIARVFCRRWKPTRRALMNSEVRPTSASHSTRHYCDY